ncbi:unnamed protein product, partial [Effrenium voratum]
HYPVRFGWKLVRLLPALVRDGGCSGCKNIRDGGESVQKSECGPFLVYCVFRSFKHPPAVKGKPEQRTRPLR